uniref:TLDc domain-containing protein n=1 Tax=Globodera pallida TaxID=36090 RepID=A0A183CRK0_GLOPA
FSPDSSDDSEDDEQTMPAENRYKYNFLQSCHDNFFRSFQDNKFVKSCHGSSSISTPSDSDSEESLDNNNSQQNDSGEESKSQSSMDESSSLRLKSILSTCGKSSLATQKHAFERRVSFADRWGMQLASYRAIPSRRVDFLFGELDFNEGN